MPDRYSADSDDHLMNMLISKGYAFSTAPSANLKVAVDCGCNCNCCVQDKPKLSEADRGAIADAANAIVDQLHQEVSFVQTSVNKKLDLWEQSKLCGCDCGCCQHNQFQVRKAPQYWVNKSGASKAARELVAKHMGLEGEKLDDYLNRNFGEIWDHYDVLGKDMVEVEQMSSFYKRLLKDNSISIQ